jgi:hypothetical protein
MKTSRYRLSLFTAVLVLMTGSTELLAQQAGPLFTERFASVFDPASRTYYSLQGTEGKQFGGQQPSANFGVSHYTGSIQDAITLYSGQLMFNYNGVTGNPAGTLGAQQRWMTELPLLETSILGAGIYMDFTQTRYNNLFQQVNVNLELLTESAWVARANAYLPVGSIQQHTGLGYTAGGAPGQLSVMGTTVGTGGINRQLMDVALMGSDLELGRKFFGYRTEVYGGYYNWNGPLAGFTNGVKGGVRAYLTSNLSGNVNVSHDQFFGTNVYGGMTLFFGGRGGNSPMAFENLMTLPAQRAQQVAVSDYFRSIVTFQPLHDSTSGDELHMYFVAEGATGAGTQADPSNVSSVLANTMFGHGSAMVLLDANGNITSPIALTQDRQQVAGGGSTGTANVDFSLALGQAPGTSVVHLSNLGGRPVLMPAAGNGVTLTNQNTIQGFTIDGSGGLTNGISGNPGAANTFINDMIIQNVAGTGIRIQPSTSTTVNNTTFLNNGTDLLLNAANSTLTNLHSTGALNGSLNLGGSGGDITGTTLISNVTISGAGGFGGILLNNAQSGATINLTNVSITGGTGSGVTVTNSQTGSIYNLTNVDILNVGGTGMSLQNSNGTFGVDSTSSITDPAGVSFAINGGAINATFNGTLNQANAASAVAISGNHTGTLNFTASSTIGTTNGDGLQFNGADGTYNFLGATTMNGGDAGIDIFNSNGQFVFTNAFINNTASGMGVKIVGGGGDAPITTFNGLNITTTSNQGFYVSNGGLTTVNGTATVNTQFGTAVEFQGTSLAAVFTDVTSTSSPAAGININNSSGTFGVTGTTTVSSAALSGLNIMGSSGLTSNIQKVTITTAGSAATDSGINLTNAGTVSILGGTIDGTTGDGIHSIDSNLTATGLTIGGISTISGDGIEVVNNGSQHTVNLSNNTITGTASGISTKDSGVAKELLLTLDGNTLQALNNKALALDVVGNGLNSTIIRSLNGGTIVGTGPGGGGGALFSRVTFDASGRALSGTQVNGGNWTIGTTANRVQGDGFRFDAPTGDLKFGTLNVANAGGTGLYVDTKTLGTTFSLGSTGGTVDTSAGTALFLDPLTANLTFNSVTSSNATGTGITLDTVGGVMNLGTVNITGAGGTGLLMTNSSSAVTASIVTVNGAATGLRFGSNTGGSFTATGATNLSNIVGTAVDLHGAAGTYNFADLTIAIAGAHTGLDLRNSNVLFTSGTTSITGDGTAGSIAVDLSGTTNPHGANSALANIQLANASGQTALINNVATGILMGNLANGSAGANFIYGNQTPLNSGSQINVIPGGVTLDTTHLTSTNSLTQGQYNFLGVSFTGQASFQKSANLIFVGSTSSGGNDGSTPGNRISMAELLVLDATPSNLDGKTIVLVNDNNGVGIDIGAKTLTLGNSTILDSFGNGQTFSSGGPVPVNVIVDTISSPVVYSDPNGAATLTNDGSLNLVTLGNGDTVQNLILVGGINTISGSGVAGVNINNNLISGSSQAGISLTNTTGTIGLNQNAVSGTGSDGILLTNAGTVSVNGGTIDGTGGDGIHSSATNLTVNGVNIGGTGTITGDGIEIVNNGSAHVVNLSNNTIKANASGISTVDSGASGELLLTLDGNTLQSLNAGSKALSILGGGQNSTIVQSMNGGTVIGGANSGGVLFNQVTFDASGTALNGDQVAAGNWTIGTNGARVQGDGLRFDAPTGDLKFGTLNVSNNAGTGLYVDTKTLGTTFALGNTGGTVDTTGGTSMFLDPLTTNLTFASVTSANSTGTGLTLDAVSGSLTIGTLNISNSVGDGVLVNNSTGTFHFNGGSVTGALGDSFHVAGGSATVTYDGSITSSANRVVLINGTTGGSTTFGGLISSDGPGQGIRLTSNAGSVTFNGDVALGTNTALTNEAVYLANNTGAITFGNLDVNVNSLTALGAIYGVGNSQVTIGGGNVTSVGAPALNIDQSRIDITLTSIIASGGADGLDLTNLASGSSLDSTTTTITGVEQTGINLKGSQGSFDLGTLDINGAKRGIDFRNSNLSFTSAITTLTGDGTASSIGIDLSGTQNPNGANSTTPNIQMANGAGETAILNNFGTGVRMGNVPDGSAGAYFIYGNQTPLNSGSQINVINGGVTLDGTHLTSTNPYTQGRYEFKGVGFTGNTSFPTGGTQLLFVGSVAAGTGTGTDPNNRMSIAQLIALDATPSNLDNLTLVLVNDSGAGGGSANLNMAANTLTLGDNTILDSFGNGQTFTSSGPIIPVNVIVDTIGATKYTDPFGNGAAILTNNGSLNLVTLGNGDTVQNVILSGGQDQVFGSGIAGVNVNQTTFNGLPGGSAIHLVNTTGTINLDNNSIMNSGNSGILLSNAGTVSITGGTIDNTSLHGIESLNTNLTVDGVTFGGTLSLAGSGVVVTNNDAANRTVTLQNLVSNSPLDIGLAGIVLNSSGTGSLTANLSGNSLAATQQGLLVNETGAVASANRIQLNLTGTNQWESGSGVYAIDINGQFVDANNSSVVITSLGSGTVTGNGTGGGVHFNNVAFDSDLSTVGNQQVAAGTWNIGQGALANQRVQGDGLRFEGPVGDVSFSTLNIYNDSGTGLYVDTKTAGTTFNLGTGTGTIDTNLGAAMFLDPLSTAITLSSVTSNLAGTDAVTFDTVTGTINIGSLTISGASGSGLLISNSSGLTSNFTTVDISNVGTVPEDNGVTLSDAGTVSILGGTIDGTTGNGILSQDTNLTASGLNIGGTATIAGDGIGIGSIAGTPHTVTVSNNTIKSTGLAISSVDSGTAGELVLSLDGNTIQSTGSLAMNITGSSLNSTIIKSMNGGTVVGNGAGGGVIFQQVTFDASGAALVGTQVDAGNWMIGTVANRISGDGLQLYYPTGDLKFGTLNIANNTGAGLYVDTKTLGTTFSLSNTGGTIDTTNGQAVYLDPLTTNLTFDAINSTNSFTNGITLDTVAGTFAVHGGTVTNTNSSDVSVLNSSATVTLSGMTLNTSGNTGVTLNGNSGPITFTDLTMVRASGDTAFNVDATSGSTGTVTINGVSSIGNTPGAAFIVGAGSRNIDATALSITNDNTTAGSVISITGQSGGTIGFGDITNNGTTATNVIVTTGQTGGTLNFGTVTITGFGDAGTDAAISLSGTSGNVNFTDLDITTTNGGGVNVGGITFAAGSTPTINATGGTALILNGTTLYGGSETFDSITTNGGTNGISLTNVTGTTTFTTVNLSNSTGAGILLSNAGAVSVNGGTIDGTGDDGIHSSDTNLTVDGIVIGGTGAITGDGIEIVNNGAAHTVNLSNNTITANASDISTVDSGNLKELVLTLDNNTLQSLNAGSRAMSILGGGLNSTIIRSMNGGTVIGGANSGGVYLNRVTFDASGTSLSGTQVAAGTWTIGTNAARVEGDGLRFDAPTGDLKFDSLNISNNNGTGLYVDTKTLGTTFNLETGGGTVDTTGGAAMFLDPLSVNMTVTSITSDGSGDQGLWLDGLSGTFNVTGATTLTNSAIHGLLIENSSANIGFSDVSVDTPGGDGIHVNSNTGTINFNGTTTVQNTVGDGIDLASAGGGVNFGTTNITAAGAHGINLGGATGSYTFGATTINGFGTNKVGVNFAGANAAATFGVTDIQNGGLGTGIDLSSTTGNQVITFATGSNISNVALGVELSSSHTVATTANANFTFGDGALPLGSTINATTTVNAIGLDAASGSYNFTDVTFTGTASLPGSAGGPVFVSATATDGVGNGSYANPYSVSDADGVTTSGTTFVFLDGTYDFNTLNGGNAFTLAKNQNVEGLDNGHTVIYGTVQPANITGNLGASGGVASRTSSLSITDSAANGIFDLAGGNSLLDITLQGSAATTYLVGANSATVGFDNTNGISLNGVTLSNPAGSATALQFTNLTGSVVVDGNNINLSSGRLLDINGGDATYTFTRGTQPDVGSTPGILTGPSMLVRNTNGGSVALNGMTLSGTGTLVTLDNNDATFQFANSTISGGVDSTLFDVDTGTGGSTTSLVFDATNSITQARGTIATIGAGSRDIDLSLVNFNNINTTAGSVITSSGQTGGTIKFGTIGISNYNNAAGTAVSLTGSGGTVTFGDLDITATNGNGLNVGAITFDGGSSPTISTDNGSGLVMSGTTLLGGAETFGSVSSTGGTNGVSLTNITGSTTITGVTISGSSGDGISLSNAGTVILNGGTIDGTGADGIHSANTNLTISGMLIGATTAPTGDGLQVVNTANRTLAIDNTTVTDATGAGITIDGSGGGTTTVTSFNGNTVSNAGSGGVIFNTVTFDATPGGGIQQVTGGNLTIGSLVTTTNVTGDGLVLNNVLGDVAFGTLNIGNDNGTGLYIRDAAGKIGSFAFSNTGGTINTSNGPAMDIDPVTMNSTFASVSSTNANGQGISGLGSGINLNTISGTVTINGGSITGAQLESFLVVGGDADITFNGSITATTPGQAAVSIQGGNSGTVTFNTGTISATNGTGLQFNNADGTYHFNGTTTLNGGDAGIDIVNGSSGTFTFGTGTTITSPSGTAFNVDGSTASVTYSGNITQANNASLVSISNETSGTVTFQTGTLSATNGNGIQLSNADNTVNFNGTTTLNGGDAGVDILSGSSGTFTFGTGTSITNPTGIAFNEDTSTANVTYNGTITKTNNANNAILINAKTGGTTAFNGVISATTTSANAINLTSNTGGTINFGNTSGASTITTTSGSGFNFTGGGSLNITGNGYAISSTSGTTLNATAGTVTATGSNNTITSTTGRAVNINGATIGGSGVSFKSVSANGGTTSAILLSGTGAGNFTVTGDGTGAAGAQGGNASGGTIQNITGADAISLNNVGGTVSLNSMSILNITASTDSTDALKTVSGIDAIQGTGTIGGLSLVGVKISNTSDMAVNGPSGSSWGGLTINNSLLEKSNRYGVSGKGDDNNEGMVRILGLNGTALITNSKFDQGAVLLDLMTQTSGNLDFTATNNTFSNTYKGFNGGVGGIYQLGSYAVRLQSQGSATMTAIVGDVNQASTSVGNTFLNDLYSFYAGHLNSADTGLIKVLVSENTFQVTNHTSPTGAPIFTIPYGSVLLAPRGVGNMDGTVSNNTFDQTFDTAGLAGSLSVAVEGGSNNQFKLTGNNFINPWDRSIEVRVNNGAAATVLVSGNTYASTTAGGSGTDSTSFTGPYDSNRFWTLNNSSLNLTYINETLSTNQSANRVLIQTSNAGDTLNAFLNNVAAPNGYTFANSGTMNLYRNGSVSATIDQILKDNSVKGGSGSPSTSPPDVSTSGSINFTNTPVTSPSYTIP